MSWQNQGAAKVFGTAAAVGTVPTITLYDPTGSAVATAYVTTKMPIINGASVTHGFANDETKDGNGDIDAVIYHGEYIEVQFELTPSGTGTGTTGFGNAIAALYQPPMGSSAGIAGMPVFPAGPFSDALNVDMSTSPTTKAAWRYAGGWSTKLSSDGHATVTATFRRYPKVLGLVAITS